MSGFLIAGGIVLWIAILMALGAAAVDGSWIAGLLAALWVVFGLGVLINMAQDEEDNGPCLRYETRIMSTGKTAMPYRVCVERGEWVK